MVKDYLPVVILICEMLISESGTFTETGRLRFLKNLLRSSWSEVSTKFISTAIVYSGDMSNKGENDLS